MKTKMRFIRRFFSVLFIACLLLACDKDGVEGPIGPQGPQGQQGEAGPQGSEGVDGEAQGVPGPQGANGADGADGVDGQAGADGQDGATGTANVIYSAWIPSDFPDPINANFDQWEIIAPELTQEIHDTGVILVYARVGTLIYKLPDSYFGTIQEHWNFRLLDINDPLIAIRVHSIDGGNIGTPFLNGDFRYVIIPGGVSASGKSSLDYTQMSYKEIAERFNISD